MEKKILGKRSPPTALMDGGVQSFIKEQLVLSRGGRQLTSQSCSDFHTHTMVHISTYRHHRHIITILINLIRKKVPLILIV